MAINLTMSGAGYDTSAPKFGTAALNAGYGETAGQTFGSAFAWECFTYGGSNPGAVKVAMGSYLAGYLGCNGSGDLVFEYKGTGDVVTTLTAAGTAATLWNGSKHHICGQVGASGGMLFLNGVLVASHARALGSFASTPIGVRNHGGAASYGWPGSIDEAVYWTAEKYTSGGFTPPTAPYVGNEASLGGLWHLDSSGTDTAGATAYITVDTPANGVAGASATITGGYFGAVPTGIDYQFDGTGGAWTAASTPTIAAGRWSFTVTLPAAGSHTISVRTQPDTSKTATSGSFTTSSGASIAVTTPSGAIAGQALALSGTYTGTAPTGIDYRFNSTGAWTALTSPTIAGGNWSASITAPTSGSYTLNVREQPDTAITADSSSFSVAANIAPNDSNIAYSPYNWYATASEAVSLNGGAYFRVRFTGGTCTLRFDVSGMTSVASKIAWRVDHGPWTRVDVAATVSCSIPSDTSAAASHLLEVRIAATTEFQVPGGQSGNRWNPASTPNTSVRFKGITLAASQASASVASADKTVLVLGDSITEGYLTLNSSAASDADRSDSTAGWAFLLRGLLGAEVGVAGFGGQGLSTTGVGSVPAFGSTWAYVYSGQARSFATEPDLIVINQGENDGVTNIVASYTSALDGILAACPTAPVVCMRPFSGKQAANIQAAIAACSDPSRVTYMDTTGFFDPSDSVDTQHPNAIANAARIAPLVANELRPVLYPASTPASPVSVWDGAGRIWS